MRALEVVVLHEQLHAALTILEVGKHRARQQLLPQRLPKALDLAAGLRMVRAALHVLDAVAAQLRLKLRRAAPRRVLAALVGEDLPRRSILRDAVSQGLQHQRAALVVGHRKTHQVAGVVIEKRGDVDPLVPPQQEREQIRLPQLVRLGTLEALRRGLRSWLRRRASLADALRLQHSTHRRGRSADAEKTLHHVADPPASALRRCRLRRENRRVTSAAPCTRLRCPRPRRRLKPRHSSRPIALHPLQRRRVRHAQLGSDLPSAQPVLCHTASQCDAHIQRPAPSPAALPRVTCLPVPRLVLLRHLSSPRLPSCQANRRTSAR